MIRRTPVLIAASLGLLSTLDSATCFAAAAPAQPREELGRSRFLKKEIKRFAFTNTTISRGNLGPEPLTSVLDTFIETLTSAAVPDVGELTSSLTSSTPTITRTSYLLPVEAQSTSTASMLSNGEGVTTVSSTPDLSPTPFNGEGIATVTSSPLSSSIPPNGEEGMAVSPDSFNVSPSSSAPNVGEETLNNFVQSSASNQIPPSASLSSQESQSSTNNPTHGAISPPIPSAASTQSGNSVTSSSWAGFIGQLASSVAYSTNPSGGAEGPPVTSLTGSPPSIALPSAEATITNPQEAPDLTLSTGSATSAQATAPAVGDVEFAGTISNTVSRSTTTGIVQAANADAEIPFVTPSSVVPPSILFLGGETSNSSQNLVDSTASDNDKMSANTDSNTNANNAAVAITTTNLNGIIFTTGLSSNVEIFTVTTSAAQPASSLGAPETVAVTVTATNFGSEATVIGLGNDNPIPSVSQAEISRASVLPVEVSGGLGGLTALTSFSSEGPLPNAPQETGAAPESQPASTTPLGGIVIPNTATTGNSPATVLINGATATASLSSANPSSFQLSALQSPDPASQALGGSPVTPPNGEGIWNTVVPSSEGLGGSPITAANGEGTSNTTVPNSQGLGSFPITAANGEGTSNTAVPSSQGLGGFPITTVNGEGTSNTAVPSSQGLGGFPITAANGEGTSNTAIPSSQGLGGFPITTVNGEVTSNTAVPSSQGLGGFPITAANGEGTSNTAVLSSQGLGGSPIIAANGEGTPNTTVPSSQGLGGSPITAANGEGTPNVISSTPQGLESSPITASSGAGTPNAISSIPQGLGSSPITASKGAGTPNTAVGIAPQSSEGLPPGQVPDSKGSETPKTAQGSGVPELGSVTASNGVVAGSSSQFNGQAVPVTAGQVIGSSTSSDGAIVPVTTIPIPVYPAAQSSSVPELGSVTVSNGVVGGSSGQPNSQDVPITVIQITRSSTLSDGAIVPVTTIPIPVYSTPQSSSVPELGPVTVSNGVVGGSSGQPNSQDVPITVGQLIGSSTSSDGAVVPVTTIPVPVYSGAQSNGVPQLGPVTASNRVVVGSSSQSNGQIVPVTAGQIVGSSTLSVGAVVPAAQTPAIAEYSTKSDGSAVLISAAAGPTSLVSNGQIAPTASENAASGQLPWVSENGGAAASNALQSGSIAAPVVTQSGSSIVSGPTVTPAPVQPQIYPSDNKGPFTQQPIGSNSMTAVVIPTSIIYEPSTQPSIQPTSIGPTTGLPSNIPLILYPTSGPVVQPSHTDLIQIGFNYSLNYPFVYNNTDSQAQIFHYIPLGICYGLEIDVKQITMQSLRAWDTSQDLHYITTLALAWIPQGLVDDLSLLVSTSSSRFYNNTDSSTRTIISMVNNAIPITGSNTTDGSNDNSVGDNPTSTGTVKSNGAPIGGDIGKSSPVRASSVGIGVGVACGAAVYGAAMFFVARRYKKRRQSHVRSPSMFSSPVMSHTGPDAGAGAALMSGAMGERSASPYNDNDGRAGSRGSGRSGSSRHQISAPVMAENSLGWN